MRNRRLPVVLTLAFASAAIGQGTVRLEQPATPLAVSAGLAILDQAQSSAPDPIAFARRASELAASLPRVEWLAEARADALGPGVEPAFCYVRDAIRYEAYAGVLRGASGTYAARAGNAVDRALLLARLLECKQVRTRFAFGTLAATDCERLWQRTFDTSIPLAPGLGTGAGPAPGGKAFRQRLVARATRDFGVVRSALGDRLPPVSSPAREDVLAEMNPHVWLQAEVDGKWIDLDPSFPDSRPGVPATAAERTAAELPAELFQRVSIRLILERLRDGKLVNDTVLELTRNAVDLVDRQVFVVHAPARQGMSGLGATLGGGVGWLPAVWIDGDFVWGKAFAIEETGSAAKAPQKGGLGDALDALSAEPEPAAMAGPVFVAEWLEFELQAPAGARELTRRVLAERSGAAWRASSPLDARTLKSLQRDAAGPFAMRALHNVWFSAGPHDLYAYADAMQDLAIELLSLAAGDQPRELDDFGANAWPIALQNFAWMLWTDHAVIPSLNDTPGVRVYTDRPRIAIFTSAPDVDGGSVVLSDLRRDDLRAIALRPSHGAVLADKKLWFALLQGALEHEGIAQIMVACGADPATVVTTSSHLSPDGVVVMLPGSSVPAAPRPDPETAARLAVVLAAKAVVVAPVAGLGASGSWWEVSPGTGDARSIGELGLHSGGGRLPPMKNTKGPQTNSYGGPRTNHTAESAKEARDAARKAANDKRVADNIKRYNENQNKLARTAGKPRGGSEYTLLTTTIVVVGSVAQAILAYIIASQMMQAVDALSPE